MTKVQDLSCSTVNRLLFGLTWLVVFANVVHEGHAQFYEPGAIVAGKTATEHFVDHFTWLRTSAGTSDEKDSERVYENQRGPVFFLPHMGQNGETLETAAPYGTIDVPVGVPLGLLLQRPIGAWDHGAGNQSLALQVYDTHKPRGQSLAINGQQIDIDFSDFEVESAITLDIPLQIGSLSPGVHETYWKGQYMLLEPLPAGQHFIELEHRLPTLNDQRAIRIPVNVYLPEFAELLNDETYSQDFNALGTDGNAVKSPLPMGWTVTDEWGFALQRDTDSEFPIRTLPRPGAFPYVTNAGVPGEEDRALSIYMPRDRDSVALKSDVSQLQFLAQSMYEAKSLQVQFDIEAWDASTSSLAASPGEAAFDVTIEIDSGNGFEPLLDLGHVSTGELQKPDGDYLNGNDAANRVAFDSGVLSAAIPAGAQLRFRWAAALDGNSDGWVFGLDNVSVSLFGDSSSLLGDFNADGILGIEDIDQLSVAIGSGNMDSQFDLDQNGSVDAGDYQHWVTDIKQTWIGDSNL
ncbi:MAG: hypothetical protein KDB27_10610, partial [Planctomycetales bacterium]|nr:hypothetical protein [Planctomycetales bacterium]